MEIVCPKCKGKGETRDSTTTNPLFVILTLGLSLAMTDTCSMCDGFGIVRIN